MKLDRFVDRSSTLSRGFDRSRTTSAMTPRSAAYVMRNLGFLARSDLPDRPGPAYLLVAIRNQPTLQHYDPEYVDYWSVMQGRGVRHRLSRAAPVPIDVPFSWGMIRIVDRLRVTNEFLSFGGQLKADLVDGALIAVFSSQAPILRRGGHSQAWDLGADLVGAFYGRLLAAVDCVPGFEAKAAAADPIEIYRAFLMDVTKRYNGRPTGGEDEMDLGALFGAEARHLRASGRSLATSLALPGDDAA